MTEKEKIELQQQAERLINNPAFVLAFEEIRNDTLSEFTETSVMDIERLQELNLTVKSIDNLKRKIERFIQEGRHAEKKLNKLKGKS